VSCKDIVGGRVVGIRTVANIVMNECMAHC
jgi:hypothetical protein